MDISEKTNNMDSETLGLKKIVVDYLHQWRLFVAVFAFSLIPAVLYLILVPRTYEITAKIQLRNDEGLGGGFGLGEAAGLMKSFDLGGSVAGALSIDDEMVILTSNDLLKTVIWKLGMQVEYLKPTLYPYKMYRETPLWLTFDSITSRQVQDDIKLNIDVAADGKVKVKVKSKEDGRTYRFEYDALPAVLPLAQGDFTLSYNERLAERPGSFHMKMKVLPIHWIAESLAEEILVEDVSKSSNIIELTCQDYERRRGIDLLNTLILQYNVQANELKIGNAEKSLAFIEGRIRNITDELHKTERAIEMYKIKHQMTDIEYDVEFYVGQMQEIQTKIIELETEIQVIEMMDAYVKDPANKYNLVPMLLSAQEGEKEGGAIAKYNEKLLERAQLLRTSKHESPLIARVNEQVDKLRESVFLTISNTRTGLRQSISTLKGKEKLLFDKMGKVPSIEREYVDYKRQQEIYQGVYLILLQKREDLALTIGEMKDQAHVVDAAFVKKKSVAPRKLYAGLGMILLTLVIPVVWIESRKIYKELKAEYKRTK